MGKAAAGTDLNFPLRIRESACANLASEVSLVPASSRVRNLLRGKRESPHDPSARLARLVRVPLAS